MATPKLDTEIMKRAVVAYHQHGTVTEAAKALGLARGTFEHQYRQALIKGVTLEQTREFEVDDLPSELPTAEELLKRRRDQFKKKAAAESARELIPVRVKVDGPFGVACMGDPHVDDNGTDIGLLESHVQIIQNTEALFAGNVGDYSNNWVGRLARLYAEQSLSAAEAWVLVEWLVQALPWMFLVSGNHDCHDDKTECLTRRGWISHSDIRDDDQVLSLNVENGQSEWAPILNKIERPHDGEMVTVETRSLSFSVTPNHRMLCKSRLSETWGEWHYRPASDLPIQFAVPVNGESRCEAVNLSDDQIALAGWVLTDGNIYRLGSFARVSLYQSKDSTEIVRLLDGLGLEYRHQVRDRQIASVCGRTLVRPARPQHEFILNAESSRRVLEWLPAKGEMPEWAHRLSAHQFGVLLDAIVAGDGCWDGKDPSAKNVAVIHGAEPFLSSLQAVAVQHGWRALLSVAREKDYRLNLCKTPMMSIWAKSQRTNYSGTVWCLTVPRGNFMVRRDGRAHFSGNCWSGEGDPIKWMAKQAKVSYESHGMRLGLTTPSGRVIRLNARHDFSGKSQYNTAFGISKAAMMGWRDHVLVAGHTHVSGYQMVKDPSSGLLSHAIRICSYKTIDRYAKERGLPNQAISPCPVVVVQPDQPDDSPKLITVFQDTETGADFLGFLRQRKSTKGAR